MALDGIYLHSIVKELKDTVGTGKIDKINQPEKDEIVLTIRGGRINYKLLISASAVYPKIHLTEFSKPNPLKAPMFCMVLRKYLTGAKIIDITQVGTDRIVIIDVESVDELGFDSVYSLIVEIMGRHSNITLVRKRDNKVIDSIKHITPDINSFRILYPGVDYINPPKSTKLMPFDVTFDTFKDYIIKNDIDFDNKFFSNIFTGVCTQFSKELKYRIENKENLDFNIESLNGIFEFCKTSFKDIKDGKFFFASYSSNLALKDFYCIKLSNLDGYDIREFSSSSKLLDTFYYEKDKFDRLNAKSTDLQKLLNNNIDRCTKKIQILESTLKQCEEKEELKIFGELLTANIYNLTKGLNSISLLNYYTNEYETIKLDENKTPSENIQSYYKKYNKLKKSEEMATIQINSTEEELRYLLSVLTNIRNCESYEEIEEIKKELMETGYVRFKKESNKKQKSSKPLHFKSSDGADIYVGKNNLQNDFLTLKFSDKQDIWLHTKNIPGSHVIIKKNEKISEKTLVEAATLAAFYSKAKDSSKVPVDYTEVRNVKKPSGAKPGMVIYSTNKTIYVDPEKIELTKVN